MCQLSFREVGEIISLIERLDCDTLTLEYGDLRVFLGRGATASQENFPAAAAKQSVGAGVDATPESGSEHETFSTQTEPRTAYATEVPAHWVAVMAPMAGNFYRAPSPDAPPFVEIGDDVEAGQTVGLIEVMKLFSELKAEQAGKVVRIDAEETALVEYGQPLVWVDPT